MDDNKWCLGVGGGGWKYDAIQGGVWKMSWGWWCKCLSRGGGGGEEEGGLAGIA